MTSTHTARAYAHLTSALCADSTDQELAFIYRAQDALEEAARDIRERRMVRAAWRTVTDANNVTEGMTNGTI